MLEWEFLRCVVDAIFWYGYSAMVCIKPLYVTILMESNLAEAWNMPCGQREGVHLVASGTISVVDRVAIFRMRIKNCVILVSRCLFLCTRNLGQYCRCSSICSIA